MIAIVGAICLLQGQTQDKSDQGKPALSVTKAMKRVSADAKATQLNSNEADEKGNIGLNKNHGYQSVSDQRGVAVALSVAIADDNKEKVRRTFDTVKKTFDLERPDGTYPIAEGAASGTGMGAQVGDSMSWLSEAVPALVRLEAYDTSYKPEIDALRGKVTASAEFIYPRKSLLIKRAAKGVNWTCRDAKTFIYIGEFLHNAKYTGLGKEFLQFALASQKSDGVFPEEGGGDMNYQSVSIRHLCEIYLLLPESNLKSAIQKGSDWYLARFTSDGRIDPTGSTRTGDGHATIRGLAKAGNQAVPTSITLALIAEVLPDSKASAILDNFSKVAFKNGRPRKPVDYTVGNEGDGN